ncbi:anti-sigma factor domain-containing protein [Sinomonas sp. ASV322]|uniref:anti-sigma factor domain-containing protein n=1 Tax=Sinomonas sp. ASV322 TaxID=3041920 RepID=UPI0027DDE491|nr:anti-sigma factor [Sinomonas sp. ASV322]MDQ4501536.1 anti-sigma factor [Sinomonas sp. ASV322]
MSNQLHLLTGAYALNALDGDERRRVESLPFGHTTAQEARELSETAALLAAGTTPVAPSSELKARLMAQIAVTPQADVAPSSSPVQGSRPVGEHPQEVTPGGEATVQGSPSVGEHPQEVTPGGEATVRGSRPVGEHPQNVTFGRFGEGRRRPFPVSSRWLAAAAAALLVAAGGAGLWGLRVQQQRDEALRDLAAVQGSRSAVINQILSASDVKVQETSVPGGGTVLVAHSRDASLAGVITIGMPPTAEGKAYELWLIDAGGGAKPVGLVASGDGSTWNELAGGVGSAAYLGVTVEPAGGSPQPSTKPLLLEPIR